LLACSLSESNAEHSQEIAVGCFGLHEGFNSGVPLLDDGAQFVSGDVHAVEVSVAVKTFNFFNLHLHLSPGLIIAISVQISQGDLKHTTSQAISGNL